jgi:tRNA(Glu) U13 pseudouridine synthase TruD
MRSAAGAVAELEEQIWREQGLGSLRDFAAPRGLDISGARRALRVPVGDATAHRVEEGAVELRFELPAGSYATVVVEEIFPGEEIEEGPT